MIKPSSPDLLNLENKEIVRKRRPIDFDLNDLEDDENKDETWNAKANGFKSPKPDSASRTKKHILPRRSASKIKFDQDMTDEETDEETDEDYILETNQTPAINKQAKGSLKKVLNGFFSVSSDELKGFYLLHQLLHTIA
jgi:hypothetical protein